MKNSLILFSMAIMLSACSPATENEPTAASSENVEAAGHTQSTEQQTSKYQTMLEQFVVTPMSADLSSLSDSDKQVLHKLVEVAKILDGVYQKQIFADYAKLRKQVVDSDSADQSKLLELFDLHFGPWDTLNGDKNFFGNVARPDGAGVYPVDMTKQEFNQWIAAHPEDEAAFKSGYTVIVRTGDKLAAIPYSQYYAEDMKKSADLMREAAAITQDQSLKTFLNKRADAFLSDEYRDSEMAWMDLDGSLEVAIGPYETYTDKLFGYKTFFEAFITVRNPQDSAKLTVYKKYLKEMEMNLPIDDQYKNLQRGSESPISVVDQVSGGGDNRPGVQTTAFNLPNDEKVRELKGSKKVMLKNVLNAKYKAIMRPISSLIIDQKQQSLLKAKYFFNETLFHELSHGLGPGSIVVNGKNTTVAEQLQESYSKIEEGKADVMGAYNMLFLMKKGALPAAERNNMLATYFAGLFRSMRFGVHEAHGAGAAFQYNYFKAKKAFIFDPKTERYTVKFDQMASAIGDLVHDICMIQAKGDYQGSKDFLAKYAVLADEVALVNKKMDTIPTDIKPIYPEI